MICDISGNDRFYIIILIFMERHIKNNSNVIFAGTCTKQRCFFMSVNVTCRAGKLCSSTIFYLKWYFGTHISHVNKIVPLCNLEIVAHIVILVQF